MLFGTYPMFAATNPTYDACHAYHTGHYQRVYRARSQAANAGNGAQTDLRILLFGQL